MACSWCVVCVLNEEWGSRIFSLQVSHVYVVSKFWRVFFPFWGGQLLTLIASARLDRSRGHRYMYTYHMHAAKNRKLNMLVRRNGAEAPPILLCRR